MCMQIEIRHTRTIERHIDDWYKHSIKKKISDIDVRQRTSYNFNAIPISVRSLNCFAICV